LTIDLVQLQRARLVNVERLARALGLYPSQIKALSLSSRDYRSKLIFAVLRAQKALTRHH
jgi:hypothetical protein